jgi:hypothetical protein
MYRLKDLQLVDEVEKQATDPMDLRLTKLRVLEEQVYQKQVDEFSSHPTIIIMSQDRLSHLSDIVSAADGVLECVCTL